ncbi:MAG: DUF342 domain-containing protein [Gemmatimonadetes bacterium]|nr:DUF342 domain-containing protein [Gemmatimonadota bacterium]
MVDSDQANLASEAPALESDVAETSPDAAQALADDDPQERALDELAAFLTAGGHRIADLPAIEARLEPAPDQAAKGKGTVSSDRSRGHRGQGGRARAADVARTADAADLGAEDLQVTVADDQLSATLLRLDEHATLRRVAAALKRNKVRHGIAVDAIKQLVIRARAGEEITEILVARGQPARAGRQATFEWHVETSGRAGTILEDGSIDLRDRHLMVMVAEGQLLGRHLPEQSGASGRDVCGRVLAPPVLGSLRVVPGAHVRVEEEAEGIQALYADAAGGVVYDEQEKGGRRRMRIALTRVSHIEQDVDYATGHVNFDGEVVVDGSVKAQFEVRASGSVTINGNIEPGAYIKAGGDILVNGGIVGDETRLEAGGKVMAKFLQGCHVTTDGDVEIGAYVFEASIRIGGKLIVAGMGEGSGRALVGGLVWAGGGCETPSLGSPSNPNIRLIVGVSPHKVDEADKLRGGLRQAELQQQELLDELGLERFNVTRIKELLRTTTDAAVRKQHVERVQRLTRLGEAVTHARERLTALAEAQREQARRTTLVVTGTVFPGPELRLGEHALKIIEETRARCYCLIEEDGQVAIQEREA